MRDSFFIRRYYGSHSCDIAAFSINAVRTLADLPRIEMVRFFVSVAGWSLPTLVPSVYQLFFQL